MWTLTCFQTNKYYWYYMTYTLLVCCKTRQTKLLIKYYIHLCPSPRVFRDPQNCAVWPLIDIFPQPHQICLLIAVTNGNYDPLIENTSENLVHLDKLYHVRSELQRKAVTVFMAFLYSPSVLIYLRFVVKNILSTYIYRSGLFIPNATCPRILW